MQFPVFNSPVTGVAVPVAALRSKESCGIGEFADIIPFADFCEKAGLNLIQLLPVNDTGTESSPYSALSAFALHPLYLRIQDLPEAKKFSSAIKELAAKYENEERFDYTSIRNAKLNLLHEIYNANETQIKESAKSGPLAKWISENPWITNYAVFMNLKYYNFEASWKTWDKMRTPSHVEIHNRWEKETHKSGHIFYAWLQMHLHKQFLEAAEYCSRKNIALKGDIPIMMNEDSCDIWANPEFFRFDLRAGSPPDDSNPTGQNWGFPIYNWDNLEEDDFSWWKARLKNAAKYYNAFRIDHILGFFRIWSVPDGEQTGALGWTMPHQGITETELSILGFTGDRLRWITQPHVPTKDIEAVNNYDYLGTHGQLHKVMDRIGDEELWLFKPSIHNDGDIRKTDLSEPVKEALCRKWRDRVLLVTGRSNRAEHEYSPVWKYYESTAWQTLSYEEKTKLEKLFHEKRKTGEEMWKKQAEKLLSMITNATDMLPCAEDLGDIPACVPEVLKELNIYGLKVMRWEREWDKQGQPFRDIHSYQENSVATPSVHDSSTLRDWWENEEGAEAFCKTFFPGYDEQRPQEIKPGKYNPATAEKVLTLLSETSSKLFVPPIQDWLALSEEFYSEKASSERINIPGSVSKFNWTYRLPVTAEDLKKNKTLCNAIQKICKHRSSK